MDFNIFELEIALSTPNDEGRNLDFTNPLVGKQLYDFTEEFNKKQETKQLKLFTLEKNKFKLLLKVHKTITLNYTGKDIVALSNIAMGKGWLKYSNTEKKLFTVESFVKSNQSLENYQNIDLVGPAIKYIFDYDFNQLIDNEKAKTLFNCLVDLCDSEIGNADTQKRLKNTLIDIKVKLFTVFQ